MEWMLLPLKRYAEFSGRSRRMEYWMFALLQFLIGMAFWVMVGIIGGAAIMSGDMGSFVAAGGAFVILLSVFGLIWLALIIPALAVTVRRLHDTDRSGWWVLGLVGCYLLSAIGAGMRAASPDGPGGASMVELVGSLLTLGLGITLLVFLFLDGTPGPNRYGADPKGRGQAEVFA